MSKYTNGPWEVARTDAGIIVRTESAKKTRYGASRYAAIGGFDRSDPEQLAEALANAHLIAAAPELLEALKMLVSIYKEHVSISSLLEGKSIQEIDRYFDARHVIVDKAIADAIAAITKATEEPYATDERTQHSWS